MIRNLTRTMAILAAGMLATPVRAEIALLRDGRSVGVASYRVNGDTIVLALDGGGEMTLPTRDVLEIHRQPEAAALGDPMPPLAEDARQAGAAPENPGKESVVLPVGGVFDRGVLRDMASRIARRYGVDEGLVHAVIQTESRYNAFAVSPRGAMGLMQLMPKTAARFEVENAFDPVENVDAGVRYLKELLTRYSGQRRLALAAYNAGEDAVERYSGIPPYRETIDYVRRVLVIAGG
jgi:hypothetical protein